MQTTWKSIKEIAGIRNKMPFTILQNNSPEIHDSNQGTAFS